MIIVDFETSYLPRTPRGEAPHGLRSQTVPEYLHDPRTECLGAAVLVRRQFGNQSAWLTGDNLGRMLAAAAEGRLGAVVCHNAAFDLSVWARFYPESYHVLRDRLRRRPRELIDTLHMARYMSSQGVLPHDVGVSLGALGDWVGLAKGDTAEAVAGDGAVDEYAIRDAEITERLAMLWVGKWPWPEWESSTMHVLMSTPGPESLRVDAEVLRPVATETEAERERASWLRKDENFAALLEKLGVEPQYKQTKTGRKKLALAKTDAFMRELLAHSDSRVRSAAELRLSAGSNINRTRAQRMLVSSGDGTRALPMSVDYYRAHTGRSGGSGGLNPQNMPRGGPHRQALMAPPGHKLVVCDASQIEVRVLAWLAGDEETLEVFRRGADPYKAFAVDLYGLDGEDAVTKSQRQVAKSAVLGLGFGAGPQGFLTYCEQMGVPMDAAEAERVVQAYRRSKPAVVAYWKALKRVERTGEQVLPSGRRMVYPQMDGETFQRPKPFSPKGVDTRSRYWHGLFCLSLDTLVLTKSGWTALRDVGLEPVWDGEEFVCHQGLTQVTYKNTIQLEGVTMTPDHRVLTNYGWKPAEESKGFKGPNLRVAGANRVCRERWSAFSLALPMPLRELPQRTKHIFSKWRHKKLRVAQMQAGIPVSGAYGQRGNAWYEQAPGLCGMAVNEKPLRAGYTPRVAQLRRPWDYCLWAVASVQKLLGGYGRDVQAGAVAGTDRQQPWLLPAELPVGYAPPASEEYQEQPHDQDTTGRDAIDRSIRTQWDRNDYASVPPCGRVGARTDVRQAVADLAECGPRNRFVVCAPGGQPFYAHNCENAVQATARDITLIEHGNRIAEAWPVVLVVHDEIVCSVPENDAERCLAHMRQVMETPPKWCAALPLGAEGDIADNYAEAK